MNAEELVLQAFKDAGMPRQHEQAERQRRRQCWQRCQADSDTFLFVSTPLLNTSLNYETRRSERPRVASGLTLLGLFKLPGAAAICK